MVLAGNNGLLVNLDITGFLGSTGFEGFTGFQDLGIFLESPLSLPDNSNHIVEEYFTHISSLPDPTKNMLKMIFLKNLIIPFQKKSG